MPPDIEVREVFGNEDIDPIPLGIRTGNLVHLTRITGAGPATGALGATIEAQMEQAHQNLQRAVEGAGGSIDNIAQVSFFVKDRTGLAAINPAWVKLFPNDADRPTYKFMVAAGLPGDCLVQVEPFAGLGSSEIADLSALIRKVHAEQGLTVMLIEHKLHEFMRLVGRVIALDFGEIIAEGTPEDIVRHPAVIEAYIGRGDEQTEEQADAA